LFVFVLVVCLGKCMETLPFLSILEIQDFPHPLKPTPTPLWNSQPIPLNNSTWVQANPTKSTFALGNS
jgi:hypothetical protein